MSSGFKMIGKNWNPENELIIDSERIRYKRNKISILNTLSSMATSHIALGTNAYFGYGDIERLKQHYHLVGLLRLLGSKMAKNDETILSRIEPIYAMLSDSNKAIHACATMGSPLYIEQRKIPTEYKFYSHIYQLVILDDFDEAERKINLLKYSKYKDVREASKCYVEFHELLFSRDKQKLEQLILKFAVGWKKRVDTGAEMPTVLTAEVMAANAVEFAKLCWLKGVEVEIDHPFVPMELLPVKPLPYYDDVYDFLSPNWVPPPQGLFSDFNRWLKSKFSHFYCVGKW